jgi:two-component system, response regulator
MTSSAEQKDLVETYRLGVNSYIQKPLDTKHFRETVNAVGFYWLMVNQPPPEEC